MTIDPKKLALAREWAEWVKDNPSVPVGHIRDLPRAAADLILSLPDTIVDGDKLREVIEQMQDSLYVPAFTRHEGEHNSEISRWKDALEALLPDPPAPPTMAEIEWDDEEHRLAEATVPELSGRPHEKVLMLEIDDFGNIRSLDPTTRVMWSLSPGRLTPTGRKYRLEPESASPRPDGCCGACPEIVGGGYDCTCADNPRCPNYQPRPEDVPVGEPWQVEFDGETAIGFRNDPEERWPWFVTYRSNSRGDWLRDEDVTLVSRLVPETTETAFDPAYTYTDRDGDEWENIDGGWVHGDTHAKRVTKRAYRCGRASLPAEYGPYTRIEDTK